MRTNILKSLCVGLAALVVAQVASAYTFIFDDTTHQPILWRTGSITMHVSVGTTPTESDTDLNHAVLAAIGLWNPNMVNAQLVGSIDSTPPADDGVTNEMFFSSSVYGKAFGPSTLAVTTTWSYPNNSRGSADIVFNNNPTVTISYGGTPTAFALSWNSYRGNQRYTASPFTFTVDIRRVALHELGHALGLDHPDQATPAQSVTAIMNSGISDLDTLAFDDTTGAQHLYAQPGGAAPANDNFANATLITFSDGRAYSGSNIYPNSATREVNEPLIVSNQGVVRAAIKRPVQHLSGRGVEHHEKSHRENRKYRDEKR